MALFQDVLIAKVEDVPFKLLIVICNLPVSIINNCYRAEDSQPFLGLKAN